MQTFFAPGRINLIGEHIDYNGGLVLPIAINLGITAKVSFRNDTIINIKSAQIKEILNIDLETETYEKRRILWQNYPLGIIEYFKKNDLPISAADISLSSNLPIGGGLSSSAALEVLISFVMLSAAKHDLLNDKTKVAQFCQQVENEFVGVKCGIMDQFAVAKGKENQAMLLNCDTLENEYIPFDLQNEYALILMNTNKKRELADSKYNERKAECDAALLEIQQQKNINYLCEADISDIEKLKNSVLQKRAKHVISENERVKKAVVALKNKKLKEFGKLMNESHESLKKDYEVTGFELDTLVSICQKNEACIGARMTGAGFGGCAIALVEKENAAAFAQKAKQEYDEKTGLSLDIYETMACEGVRKI
ncbi:MAG: galactokinase [Chitinophagales bacterium]